MGISAEKCAEVILRGVARDKSIIPVTTLAHLIWRMARVTPIGVLRWVRRDFDKWRHRVRPTASSAQSASEKRADTLSESFSEVFFFYSGSNPQTMNLPQLWPLFA